MHTSQSVPTVRRIGIKTCVLVTVVHSLSNGLKISWIYSSSRCGTRREGCIGHVQRACLYIPNGGIFSFQKIRRGRGQFTEHLGLQNRPAEDVCVDRHCVVGRWQITWQITLARARLDRQFSEFAGQVVLPDVSLPAAFHCLSNVFSTRLYRNCT